MYFLNVALQLLLFFEDFSANVAHVFTATSYRLFTTLSIVLDDENFGSFRISVSGDVTFPLNRMEVSLVSSQMRNGSEDLKMDQLNITLILRKKFLILMIIICWVSCYLICHLCFI